MEENKGLQLILEERKRQIEVEGFTREQDKQYKKEELFVAACCYQSAEGMRHLRNTKVLDTPNGWPFDPKWWKPSPDDRIKELKKAGALFMAHNDSQNKTTVDGWVLICADEINKLL